MAVIIRETRMIDGKPEKVKVFKTKRLLTGELRDQAEKLDLFLAGHLQKLEAEMKSSGLLDLKGKKGEVLKLWYEVGKHLSFVMDASIVPAEDREFVWRAIYDHVRLLHDGPIPERARRNPATSYFSYCYQLSRFPWEFVESAGDWTSWHEFFDRSEPKNDPRIIEWLGEKARGRKIKSRQNWLRPLTKAIHRQFEKKDTTVFSTEELYKRLDSVFAQKKKNG